jgi:hypothetical protein
MSAFNRMMSSMCRATPTRSQALTTGTVALYVIIASSCGKGMPGILAKRPSDLRIISGNGQIGLPGQELPDALVVRVTNSSGAPLAGQIINFKVVTGGGSVFAGVALSDADGQAKERWTLGATTGQQQLEARAVDSQTGLPIVFAIFQATATAGRFAQTGNMVSPRARHTATLLANGKVLVTGGVTGNSGGNSPVKSTELYDPATGTFSAAANMSSFRADHSATLLSDGKVLIIGGTAELSLYGATASAEIYDPASGTFAPTGSLNTARSLHTATRLSGGKVLVAGGYGTGGWLSGPNELYDPLTGLFTVTGSSCDGNGCQVATATLLKSDHVLVTEWWGAAKLYDPASGAFAPTGTLNVYRNQCATATSLENGNVVIAGGTDGNQALATVELFDVGRGTFAVSPNLLAARCYHAAVPIHGGFILVVGGMVPGNPWRMLASTELREPRTGVFVDGPNMSSPRTSHQVTLLQDGSVLLTGGYASPSENLASAEIFYF